MGIKNKLIQNLPKSSIDSTAVAQWDANSGGNSNIVSVTTEAQLYDSGNDDKLLSVQSDITLTANRTLASNITLIDGGGSIISGGYTLTGVDTKLQFITEKVFLDFYEGVLDGTWILPSYFSLTNIGARAGGEILMNDISITAGQNTATSLTYTFTTDDIGKHLAIPEAGVLGTDGINREVHNSLITGVAGSVATIADNAIGTLVNGNATVSYDNQTAVRNALVLLNQNTSQVLSGANNIYFHSTVAIELYSRDDPTNWAITNSNKELMNVDFQIIPHDIPKTETLVVDKCFNTTFNNVRLFGDRNIHGKLETGKLKDDSHGFVWRTMAKNVIMNNCTAANFFSDGAISKGEISLDKYISGSNKVGAKTASTITIGGKDLVTGADIVDATKFRTDTPIDISDAKFQEQFEAGEPYGWYKVGGTSFAGWNGLKSKQYRPFYYDDASRTTLLYVGQEQYIYDKIPIYDTAWKFVDFVFDEAYDFANVDLMVAPHMTADGVIWNGGEIYNNGRDGVSNPPDNSYFKHVNFWLNGHMAQGPGFDFNAEDRRRYCRNINIMYCTFRDSFGAISIIGAENCNIVGNKLLPNTRDLTLSPANFPFIGLSVDLGYNNKVTSNTIWGRACNLDRGVEYKLNTKIGGNISYVANDCYVTENFFEDCVFKEGSESDNGSRVGYPTIFKNNRIRFTRGFTPYWFDKDRKGAFIDNDIKFNSIASFNGLIDEVQDNIELGLNGENQLFSFAVPTTDWGGYFEGNTITGMKPPVSIRDTNTAKALFPLNKFNGNKIDSSLEFTYDKVGSYVCKDNIIQGSLQFIMYNFPDTVTGTPETIRFENCENIIDNSYNWTSTAAGCNLVNTEAKYYNLEFYRHNFRLEKASGVTGGTNRFIRFRHLGTTLLDECDFYSETAKTIDFGSSIFTGTGVVTVKNPRNVENITFVGAVLLFNAPNELCPSYVDNATALATLGEGWSYKNTTTGKFDVTNL